MLVVDDEPQVVWVLQFSLEAEGYTTFAASNGVEALAEIARAPPEPDGARHHDADAWTAGRARGDAEASASSERPRVVIVSALSSLRDRAKAAELGADAYVPKPFNVEELLEVLHGLERAS